MSADPPMIMEQSQLDAFHHIEFYVSNAHQAADYYCLCFGFEHYAIRTRASSMSVAIRNGTARFVFTSFSDGNKSYASHMIEHGDSVKDIALTVHNLDAAIDSIIENGGCLLDEPRNVTDNQGSVRMATIATKRSDMRHTLIETSKYKGIFLPEYVGYERNGLNKKLEKIPIEALDHVVENFPIGALDDVTEWYFDTLNLQRLWSIDEKICHSEFSAMRSILLTNETHSIQVAVCEPVLNTRRGRSQIQEFVDFNGGPGIQHMALRVSDIVTTIEKMKRRGVEFLTVPSSYYEDLEERLGNSRVQIAEDLKKLRELSILVDFDDNGYLLQIFTQPVQDRPTLFIEVIQRRNFNGFGAGNFKALFDAVEREQAKRGTLVVDESPTRHQ